MTRLGLGYRRGELSTVYPVARGGAALLGALSGILLVGERPGPVATAGVAALATAPYYAPPPVYYAPPPVYAAPPPVAYQPPAVYQAPPPVAYQSPRYAPFVSSGASQ